MQHSAALNYYHYVEELLRPQDVHDANAATQRAGGIVQTLLFALILTVIHAVMLYLLITESINPMLGFGVHIGISVILGIWSYAQYRANADVPFMMMLSLSNAFMGIFGTAGTLLCIIMYGLFRQQTTSFKEWFDLIFPPDLVSDSEEVYNKIVVGIDENPKPYDVMPFIDVMELGNEAQKRRALSRMTIKFHPRLAPAFQKALKDPSNAIRVQASTSVAKIETKFMEKLAMIETARKREPNNQHVLFALAQYYDDYAYTGLLGPDRELNNRKKAIETYKSYLQHDPNHQGAWTAIGRLLFRSQQWSEAADWFRNAMERGWHSKTIVLWYMECLYRLGQFSTLRQIAREHGSNFPEEDVPQEVRDSIALWTG